MQKRIKKHNYRLRTSIADLQYYSNLLVNARYEQLIAFNITGELCKLETYPYINLRITTEELYSGFFDDKRTHKFRSYFMGESAHFAMRLIGERSSSGYYEIVPPKNTIITKVRSDDIKKTFLRV